MYSIQEYLDDAERRVGGARAVSAKYKDARFDELPDGRDAFVSDLCCADVVGVELVVSKAEVRSPLYRTVYAIAYTIVHHGDGCRAMVYSPRNRWKPLYAATLDDLVGPDAAIDIARMLVSG